MNDPPLNDAKRWLAQAHHDLGAARHAAQGDYPETACFLAQQATEKVLKAFLYAQRESGVRGHSLREFLDRCVEYDPAFAQIGDRAATLDQYYIPTRYPDGLPGSIPHEVYTGAQAQDAIALGQEVLDFVSGRLQEQYPGQW